jgi:probable HAF family extracellular repeat protein
MNRLSRLCLVAAALGAPALAQDEPTHTAVHLGLLPGAFSNVPFAVNNAGAVVGWNQGPQAQLRAFIWRPGEGISELVPPPGFTESRATDISHTGIVVGGANTGLSTLWAAWRLVEGEYTIIPPLPGGCAGMLAHAVNDAGEVVGQTCPDGGLEGTRAWYYSDATGTIDLTPLGILSAFDISNAGVVTGEATGGAYRWSLKTGLELLPTLPPPYDEGAVGQGINESGQVAGYSVDVVIGRDHWRAFRFSDGEGVIELSDGLARTTAYAINEAGHVVGTNGTTSTTDQRAWVWTPEAGRVFLAATLDGTTVVQVTRAVDISDSGQIVGNAGTAQDPSGGALLTPIGAEPPCRADWDRSGAVTSDDYFLFLDYFFAGEADFNADAATNSDDFFAFLTAFFEGCR